jgi:hypothetical protein
MIIIIITVASIIIMIIIIIIIIIILTITIVIININTPHWEGISIPRRGGTRSTLNGTTHFPTHPY